MTMDGELPDISHLELDGLLALRATIDARLQEKRNALLEQAERVNGVIASADKRRRARTATPKAT